MKKTQSKIKPIKFRKELGTTYCLKCKDSTHNFRPQKVKMTNKGLREKSVLFVKIFKTKTQQQKIIQYFAN